MIRMVCAGCGRPYFVPDNFAGKTVRCVRCSHTMRAPSPDVGGEAIGIGAGDDPLPSARSAPVEDVAPEPPPAYTRVPAPALESPRPSGQPGRSSASPGQPSAKPGRVETVRDTVEARRAALLATAPRPSPSAVGAADDDILASPPPGMRQVPPHWRSARLATTLIVLGVGGILLPLIGVQFKLLIILGPFALPVGILMAAYGTFLLFYQRNLGGGILSAMALIGAAVTRVFIFHAGLKAVVDPLSVQEKPERPAAVYVDAGVPTYPMPAIIPAVARFSPRAAPKMLLHGAALTDVTIDGTGSGLPMHAWLVVPPGRHDPASLPCVVTCPAGSRMIHGCKLDGASLGEATKYADAGFAVLCYELPGDWTPNVDAEAMLPQQVNVFRTTRGGLTNGKLALDWLFAQVPEVDRQRVFAAGRDSAGSIALRLAASDSRVRGVAAYAPWGAAEGAWPERVKALRDVMPDLDGFLKSMSAASYAPQVNVPVMIFRSLQDTTVTAAEVAKLAGPLQAAGKDVDVISVPAGPHDVAALNEGIAYGIQWMQDHGANATPVNDGGASAGVSGNAGSAAGVGGATGAGKPPGPAVLMPAAPPPPSPPGPLWTPDPAQAAARGQPDSFGGYTLRLPAGFSQGNPGEWTAYSGRYVHPAQITLKVSDRTNFAQDRPTIQTAASAPAAPPPQQELAVPGGTVETGRIDGIRFTHATLTTQAANTQRVTSVYSGFDDKHWVVIELSYWGPPNGVPAAMEAAARSLKRAGG